MHRRNMTTMLLPGSTLKRIDREISVAEQEYLELLKGLNLAKLKVQDVELSSNIKAVDPPYYPLRQTRPSDYFSLL